MSYIDQGDHTITYQGQANGKDPYHQMDWFLTSVNGKPLLTKTHWGSPSIWRIYYMEKNANYEAHYVITDLEKKYLHDGDG